MIAGWTASKLHYRNIMSALFVDVAVACGRKEFSAYRLYWLMELAPPLYDQSPGPTSSGAGSVSCQATDNEPNR